MGSKVSGRTTRGLAGFFVIAAVLSSAVFPATSVAQAPVEVVSDVRYATHSGIDLFLDVYVPPGEGPFPAVVVIPGGQWVNIEKTKHSDVPTYFAAHGIAAFAIEYRSAAQFPYPAAIEDVKAAVRWVREHASSYNVDPRQLGAIGVSSGGHLAALVGAMGRGPTDDGVRVSVVVSWSGPMDLRPLVESADEELRRSVRAFLGCPEGVECAQLAVGASPINYVDPTDPPMVLVNGDDEIIPIDQAESMGRALEGVGVEAHVRIIPGGHGPGYGGGEKVLDEVIPFAQAWIEGGDVSPAVEGATGAGGDVSPPVEGAPAGEAESVGGKDQSGEAASRPSTEAKPGSSEGGVARDEPTSSLAPILLAIVLVALTVVLVQLLVIVRLRRRVRTRSSLGGSERIGAEGP